MTDAVSDVANPGLIRPPFVYLIAIALGVMLQLAVPLSFFPRTFNVVVGASLVVGAIALFISAVGKFRAAGTAVPANQPTTAIVRSGPYRFSRNPIYLAFSLLQLGIAIWVNSLWLLATLVAAVALIHVVIGREERYLERKFGAEYLEYKAAVRRWL
jgi:protein-S-isoprenylcysteine O-methyltransferase Ste14